MKHIVWRGCMVIAMALVALLTPNTAPAASMATCEYCITVSETGCTPEGIAEMCGGLCGGNSGVCGGTCAGSGFKLWCICPSC